MIKNYFKIAFRNLLKNKTYSFINIFGLAIGLTSFLLIALYVFDELTADRFHKDAANIYRLVEYKTTPEGKESVVAAAAYQMSARSVREIPGVKNAVRLAGFGRANFSDPAGNNPFYEMYWVTNQGFFDMFDYKIIGGEKKSALVAPRSIVLTETTARKVYGSIDIVGKPLKLDRDSIPYTITAVIQDFPSNSHLDFSLLVSESSMSSEDFSGYVNSDWTSNAFSTYLQLDKNADPKKIETSLDILAKNNRKADYKIKSKFILQPIKDIHFYSQNMAGGFGGGGNIYYIYVFSIVAIFVLLIACINYMNLTTARFANRAKEIAIRKVAGANRRTLISQFLSEAVLMTMVALIIALIAIKLVLPFFNSFTEKQLTLNLSTDYRIYTGIVLVLIGVGLISGLYPALFQSGLNPLSLLKSKISQGKSQLSIRKVLVIFQFALSIIMIIATITVYLQLKYVNNRDMGFNKNQLVVVDINSGKVRRGAETIKAEFAALSNVTSVTVSSRVPGEWKNLPKAKVNQQNNKNGSGIDAYFVGADEEFLKTFQVSLLKGRNFLPKGAGDSASVLINESAAKALGITNPAEQILSMPATNFGGDFETLPAPFVVKVIGIVKDFNFRSLHETVAPMMILSTKNPIHSIDYFTARIGTQNAENTLKEMEKIIHNIDAAHLFEFNFLDRQWALFYREDQKRQTIFIGVAILTILIACLGLFGLATYAAEQRIKEIGIRKVLGASVGGIVNLLSKDFLKLVIIAAIIAFPLAWWVMHSWLQSFAYRIGISWWIFAAAGAIAIFIALFTISFQAIRAAIANPVKSLRSE